MQNEIKKINALDRMKDQQERKLAKHNRMVKSFEEMAIDFMVRHDVLNNLRTKVLSNRVEYAGFYILATLEMLKYGVKEDYENSKTEINLMPIEFSYIKPDRQKQADIKNANFKNLKKRMNARKVNARKGKHAN